MKIKMIDLKDDEIFNEVLDLTKRVLMLFTDDNTTIERAALAIVCVLYNYDSELKDAMLGREV